MMIPHPTTAIRRAWIAAWLIVPALGCTSGRIDTPRIAPETLLAGSSLPEGGDPSVSLDGDVLAVSPAMAEFLAAHVSPEGSPELKLRQLVAAIIDSSSFGVEYDDRTRTASETFRERRGNCLSFSTLFVAMARHVGLKAEYQEVDVPPDWTLDRETFVLNQHVNVFIDLETAGTRVIDFNIGEFKATYDLRRISDARALAHYYNNIGVERMQEGDSAAALACFARAIARGDSRFSPAWTNLGTLYLRGGNRPFAEAAYLTALDGGTWDLVAMSNLARYYQMSGDGERATAYGKRVAVHRKGNPYYRFHLARRAYDAADYDRAIDHLRYAVRKRPREDEFYFLLGMCHLQKGDVAAARRWLSRAEQVAATDALKRKYSNKIDILMRSKLR